MSQEALRYQDIVKDYGEYLRLQREEYFGFESEHPHWREGQKRYIDAMLSGLPRETPIADIACGDGVGLCHLRALGFTSVVGVELQPEKAARAEKTGARVLRTDMHDLSALGDGTLGVVYSSHSLEHAYRPAAVIAEFRRILRDDGLLFVVLPYPDTGTGNDRAHGAKYELRTNRLDGGRGVLEYFAENGFVAIDQRFDSFREPEIWLVLQKA